MFLRQKMLSGFGSSLEWFDFALYGFFAPIFSKIFFSSTQNHWVTLITAYGVFAIGFLARPIGAILFGYLGDKYGRVLPLKITPLAIAITTGVIAFLPSYNTTGSFSILLLTVIRIIQGVLLGGEYSGNMVYLCESSPRWRYLLGSFASCTGSFGIVLASAASALTHALLPDVLYDYGWRLPFLLAIPIGIFTFLIRLKIPESSEFNPQPEMNPVVEIIKNQKIRIFSGFGLIYLHATSFYFVFMFLPVFLNQIRHLQESASLINNTWFLLIHLLLIPLFGLIIPMLGGFRVLMLISIIFCFSSLPAFYLLSYGNHTAIFYGLLWFSIITAVNGAVIPGLLAEITPKSFRCTLLALVFNIGFGVAGGLTPTIALLLVKNDYGILSPAWYLTAVSAVTFLSAFTEKKHQEKNQVGQIKNEIG